MTLLLLLLLLLLPPLLDASYASVSAVSVLYLLP